jgi:4-diphosphocytidyl-2-C-methyl-D-erythritol kinase
MPTRSVSRSSGVRVRAFAKINLSLRVVGVRADGYHDLRTIFQSIALHDTIVVRRERGPFRLECNDPECPADSTNLVGRAAAAAWTARGGRGQPRDVAIRVTKEIPIKAGLGGGSSDAAATLRALSRIWRIDEARLPALASEIGADVPYFLEGGTALGLDRGDLLFPLVDEPPAWVTLVVPSFGVSTEDAYRWYDADAARQSGGARPTLNVARSSQPSGGRSDAARRLQPGGARSPNRLALRSLVENDLQAPVARRHPEIARIVAALGKAGAAHAAMSGSGSAVFGLFAGRTAAMRAAIDIARRGRRTIVTRTIGRDEYRRLAAK